MARLLLVDAEKTARALYGDWLRARGHEVTAVTRLREVQEALARERYDLVVTEVLHPGDGLEVLRHTREHHPGTEVVLLVGPDTLEPAVRALQAGAAEYLLKPVAPEVLEHAVDRTLSARQLSRENAELRRRVTLLETGQHISSTLDRHRLTSTTCEAFMGLASAGAVMLLQRDGELLGTRELAGPAQEAQLLALLAPRLRTSREPLLVEGLPPPWPYVLAVPALEGGELFGHALLLYPHRPAEGLAEVTGALARSLALALRNLGRIAEVEDQAYLDDLTQLFNTRYLHLMLEREVKSAQQTQGAFSLLFLDLDFFKDVNDTHGHLMGSRLLVEMAHVLKGCLRERDVVVRYGGDEYVVLLRGTDSAGALQVAERIRRTVEQHRFLQGEGYALALSTCVGVASYPEHTQDKGQLLDLADRAMYRGKRGSRNVVFLAELGPEPMPPGRHPPLPPR